MMVPLRRSLIVKEHAQPALPRGHRVRLGADRRREGRRPGAHRLPGRWASRSSTRSCRRSSSVIAETPALASRADQPVLPVGDAQRRDHARVPGRRLHHRPAHRRRAGGGRRARVAGADPAARRRWSPPDAIAAQLVKLGYLTGIGHRGRPGRLGSGDAHLRATPPPPSTAPTSARSARARWRRAASSRCSRRCPPSSPRSRRASRRCAQGGGRGRQKRTERDLPHHRRARRQRWRWCWSWPCCPSCPAPAIGSKLLLGRADRRVRLLLRHRRQPHRRASSARRRTRSRA